MNRRKYIKVILIVFLSIQFSCLNKYINAKDLMIYVYDNNENRYCIINSDNLIKNIQMDINLDECVKCNRGSDITSNKKIFQYFKFKDNIKKIILNEIKYTNEIADKLNKDREVIKQIGVTNKIDKYSIIKMSGKIYFATIDKEIKQKDYSDNLYCYDNEENKLYHVYSIKNLGMT